MLKMSYLIIINVLDCHLDVLDGFLDPGLLGPVTAPGIKVGGPSFGVLGVKTKVVIDGGNVVIGGVKVGWSRASAMGEEFLNVLAWALIDEMTLGQKDHIVDEAPNDGGGLMDGKNHTFSQCLCILPE